jgi:multicomponent Na+:H+ antiporter subunit C
METAFAVIIGVFVVTGAYLLLSRHTIRMVLGIALFGNAVNLILFTSGRLTREVPPVIPDGHMVPPEAVANPLPQALILTAIVISFSFFAFLLVLLFRSYQALGTDNTDEMRVAEPEGQGLPPLGY